MTRSEHVVGINIFERPRWMYVYGPEEQYGEQGTGEKASEYPS